MPNIDLGTFVFDTAVVEKNLQEVTKKQYELKLATEKLKEEGKDLNKSMQTEIDLRDLLIKSGATQSKAYKDNEVAINSLNKQKEELFKKELKTKEAVKNVNKEYRDTIKVVDAFSDSEGKLVDSLQAVDIAIQRENKSISEARASNKELLAIRNELNLSTAEGVEANERLNDKLNENNQFIKENVSGYEQQKINIGDYEGALDRSLGPLGEFLALSQTAGGVMPLVAAGITSAKVALKGLTQSAIAFIATPVGAIIAVLAVAFLLVKNALDRSEESTNKLSKAVAPLTGLFKKVLSVLEPLGEFLIDGLVKGLELAEESFYAIADAAASALKFLGFDDAADSITGFKNDIKDTSDAARDLAQAEADLAEAQRKQRITQLEYQREAEKYRQLRDDETKTIEQRKQANEDLLASLERQAKEELRLAGTALLVANLRIKQEGRTKETLDAQADAMTELADIEERIEGQRSESLTNRNSLDRDALSLAKERQDLAIKASEDELNLFIAQQGFRSKTAEEQLATAKKVRDEELKIQEEKLRYKKVTEIEYQAEVLNIQNNYLELQRDLVIANAERERELLMNQIELRKSDLEAFTQERLDFEVKNSQDILENERLLAETKLEQGAITEQEFQDQLQVLRDNARVREDESRIVFEEADKDRKLINLENQRILDEEKFLNDFDLQSARLEAERQQEIEAAKKTGADLALINQKYANLEVKIQEEKEKARLSQAAATFGGIAELLGKETAAGKAAAIAQATINTYQGVTEVLRAPSVLPEPFGTIQKIVSTGVILGSGLSAVQNIAKTKAARGYVSDRRGTLLKGARHSGGGIQIEAEDGEPILTRKAFQMFPDLISEINVAGGGIPLARRGMLAGNKSSNSSAVQNKVFQNLDIAVFSDTISESVRRGSLEGSSAGTMQGSQQGIIGLSENRSIQQSSAF